STCNPTKSTDCKPDPALSKAAFYDFTKGTSSDWTPSTGVFPTYNASGAIFSIIHPLDSPTLFSNWYIMYGRYDIVAQIAPGHGAVSSSVLMSDDKDEIDLEWVGSQTNSLQCNYFGQAQEGSEQTVTVSAPSSSYHTYTIDWTPSSLSWIVDGKTLRTIPSSSANYPQTPMKLQIGVWPGGDPSEPSGTQSWAEGPINYADGPFTMIVKSVTAYDYSTGSEYSYQGTSGKASSIEANGGKIAQYSNINGLSVSTASMTSAGSSSTSSAISSSIAPSSSSVSAPAQIPSTFTTLVSTVSPSSTGGAASTVSSVVPASASSTPSPTPVSGSGSASGS
ncbi:glycoside hydrolase family 16 protein, partial [Viridothelium virens]